MAAVTSAGRASGLEPLELRLDSRAEEGLYRRNAGRVFGFCLSHLGRREDAEDAVQTTFLHAVRSLRRGVVPLVESAWLLGIARNVCRERWQTAGRQGRLESSCDPLELDQGRAAPEERREELFGLEDALTRLPEQQRRAILLRDWRGLSYAEVADQLGVSHAAVETLIFRGRRTLAELLREEPQATRRRLASLGNLGSLLTAAKTAFGGAAAATKLAVAFSVTAVAVTTVGAAVTASPSAGSEPPASRTGATPPPAPATAPPQASPAAAIAAFPPPSRTRTTPAAGKTAPTAIAVPAPAEATAPAVPMPALERTLPPPPAESAPPVHDDVSPVPAPVELPLDNAVIETVAAVAAVPPPVIEPAAAVVPAPIAELPPVPVTLPEPESEPPPLPALPPLLPLPPVPLP